MIITVDIVPEIEAELARQASFRGEQVEAYIASLLEEAVHAPLTERRDFSQRASALDWSQCPAVESVSGNVSGAWVFKDTRMPVAAVFENLEDGVTIGELVELYAGLTTEQIAAVLDFAARSLRAPARPD
jgi:uncharacterized protein (DUF433 family)